MIPRYVKAGEMLALASGRLLQDRKGFFWMMGSGPLPNERQGDAIIVHVRGELEHHKEDGCAESYEGILEKFRCAYAGQVNGDEDADDAGGPPKRIILCLDSPGGVVSGLNECVAELQRLRKANPEIKVTCFVNEMACSAAYALACSCDEIVCPPSAILGSIGVISTMISAAARDKKDGFDVRLLTSGARKADGHLHAPIDETAVKVEMGRVEKLALAFFRLAGKARGISVNKIRSLQAGIFLGKDAIREGLADRVSSYSDLLAGTSDTSPSAAAGGNQTDRRLKGQRMNLATLIKKTKAAIATEDDPKKLSALSTALGTYSAALEAYKKTEKHIEHVKTEESADEDEEEEAEESEEKSSEEEEKKASAKKADEEEASAKADDEGDDEDDDEDDDKDAKKAKALVQSLTGKAGAAGRGELRAMAMLAAKAEERLAALEKKNKTDEKKALIASVTGKYFTPTEAKDLASMPLAEVRSLVAFAKKRGTIVHTSEGELVHPKNAKPGTEASLPKEVISMIDAAMADVPADKKTVRRAEMVEAHIKARSAMNGAGERY